MRNSLTKAFFCIVAGLCSVNASAESYQLGNYPRFSNAQLFATGESVSDKPNFVLDAIEAGKSVDLKYNSSLIAVKRYLFPSSNFGPSYNADKLASRAFVEAMSNLVSEFACAEYRFRNRLPTTDRCNGYVADRNNKEHMPFVSGQFVSNRLETHLDDRKNGVSFSVYLKSTDEVPLSSAFGSVHEFGHFFGRLADRRSLILSVNLEAYWWNIDHQRKGQINKNTEVYFLVLPKALDIAKQKDQEYAANFAISNAKILVIEQD